MSALRRVENAPELLDGPRHDRLDLLGSLEHIAQINQWLGGTRSLIRTLQPLLQGGGSLLDIGTGNASVPVALVRWARARNLPLTVHAVDAHEQILELARENCRPYPEITIERADARALPFNDGVFTCAVCTLTLHHFEGADLTRALQEAERVSARAVVVSDLERSWPNYLGARLLAATWWRRNPLTRHDGPLSVLRAFTPAELQRVAERAGLRNVRVHRYFFYRLVLVANGTAYPSRMVARTP